MRNRAQSLQYRNREQWEIFRGKEHIEHCSEFQRQYSVHVYKNLHEHRFNLPSPPTSRCWPTCLGHSWEINSMTDRMTGQLNAVENQIHEGQERVNRKLDWMVSRFDFEERKSNVSLLTNCAKYGITLLIAFTLFQRLFLYFPAVFEGKKCFITI
jgi:hypothetical protein